MAESSLVEIEAPTTIKNGMDSLDEWSQSLVVVDGNSYEEATGTLKEVKRVRKEIVAFFAEPKKNAHAAWKSIVAREKALTGRLDAIERRAKGAMLDYRKKEEERVRKEQERLRVEAEERARKERERLAKRAEAALDKGNEEKAESLIAEADAVEAVAPIVEADVPTSSGASAQKRWTVKSVDKAALVKAAAEDGNLLGYLDVNEKALRKVVTAMGGEVSIPGVEFEQAESLRIGR